MRISDWSSDVCSSDLLRHQYAGAACIKKLLQLRARSVVTGTFKQYVDIQFFPVDFVGTACVADLNGVAIDHQTILGLLSLAGKNAVCGVELRQIRHGLQVKSEEQTSELPSLIRTSY